MEYTGGTFTDGIASYPYDNQYGYEGYSFWGYQAGAASCQGQITATFIFEPDYVGEEPPKSAVVQEICTVHAYASSNGGDIQAEVNNDLSGPFNDIVYDEDVTNPTVSIKRQSGARYTIKNNPGPSFTVHCSPSASASGGAGTFGYGSGEVDVQYRASVFPVEIELTGATQNDGNQNALIGKGITGNLVCAIGTTLVDQWTVPGRKFAKFDVAQDKTWGHPVDLEAGELVLINPHWFWKEGGGPYTVSCNGSILIVNPLTGVETSIGTVTGECKIVVWAPTYLASVTNDVVVLSAGTGGYVRAGRDKDTQPGIEIRTDVTEPAFLLDANGPGDICWLQLCTLNRATYGIDGDWSEQCNVALDADFPYGITYSARTNAVTHTDSPQVGVGVGTRQFDISDSFLSFFMYRPGGGADIEWVPLGLVGWHWETHGSRPNGTAGFTWSGSVWKTAQFDTHDHPSWTTLHPDE